MYSFCCIESNFESTALCKKRNLFVIVVFVPFFSLVVFGRGDEREAHFSCHAGWVDFLLLCRFFSHLPHHRLRTIYFSLAFTRLRPIVVGASPHRNAPAFEDDDVIARGGFSSSVFWWKCRTRVCWDRKMLFLFCFSTTCWTVCKFLCVYGGSGDVSCILAAHCTFHVNFGMYGNRARSMK